MYTSIGVIQRDAPSQGHLPAFRAAQQQMAQDLLASVRAFKKILKEDLLPSSGVTEAGDGWPQAEDVRASMEARIALLEREVEQGRARLAQMQSVYDNIIQENIHK